MPSTIQSFKAKENVRQDVRLEGMPFGSRGGLSVDYVFPLDAVYKIDITLGGALQTTSFGNSDTPAEFLEVSLDGESVKDWKVEKGQSPEAVMAGKIKVSGNPMKLAELMMNTAVRGALKGTKIDA